MPTYGVILDTDKLYHSPDTDELDERAGSYAESTDVEPAKTGANYLPTVMYGDRTAASLGYPAVWVKVIVAGTNEEYLTPAYLVAK